MLLIDQILDSNKPIWVRNVHKPAGVVVLTLSDNSGRTAMETIPKVRHPVCLSARATPNMLRNSMNLRDLVQKGVLQLVTDDEANEYFRNNPDAAVDVQLAYQRLGTNDPRVAKNREIGKVGDELLHHKLSDSVTATSYSGDEFGDALTEPDPDEFDEIGVAPSEEDASVKPRVKAIMESLGTKEMNIREVKAELGSMDLSEDDLAYVVSNSTGVIEKWAKSELLKIRSRADEEELADEDE